MPISQGRMLQEYAGVLMFLFFVLYFERMGIVYLQHLVEWAGKLINN